MGLYKILLLTISLTLLLSLVFIYYIVLKVKKNDQDEPKFKIGDRVQVRDQDYHFWRFGKIKRINPVITVQVGELPVATTWKYIEPLNERLLKQLRKGRKQKEPIKNDDQKIDSPITQTISSHTPSPKITPSPSKSRIQQSPLIHTGHTDESHVDSYYQYRSNYTQYTEENRSNQIHLNSLKAPAPKRSDATKAPGPAQASNATKYTGSFTGSQFSNATKATGLVKAPKFSDTTKATGPVKASQFSNATKYTGSFTGSQFSNVTKATGLVKVSQFSNASKATGPIKASQFSNATKYTGSFTGSQFSNATKATGLVKVSQFSNASKDTGTYENAGDVKYPS